MVSAAMAHFRIPRRPPSVNDNDFTINWRRGLFRVWLLISMAWVMGWVVYLVMYGIGGGFHEIGDFLKLPVLFFGPPLALFAFGVVARWALLGFAPDKNRSGDQQAR
jgi:hypothetical protein